MKPLEYIAEPKIDGLSFSARFVDGIYVHGLTRGDGEIGERVTAQLAAVQNWPRRLVGDFPRIFEPRGEVYLTKENFALLNTERAAAGLPLFANARNAAAGSLRQEEPAVTAARRLDYLVHGWGEISDDCVLGDSYFQLKNRMRSWGLQVVPSIIGEEWYYHDLAPPSK